MKKWSMREGFTLVELTLAMLFIGLLSISVVLIISNTVSAFQRGMRLSRINSTGTEIADDMRTSIQNSSAKGLLAGCYANYYSSGNFLGPEQRQKCEEDNAKNYVAVTKTSRVTINGTVQTMPIFGAFCTGSYTYIWNSGYFEDENANFAEKRSNSWARIRYLDNGEPKEFPSASEGPYRLIRVQDESRIICMAAVDKTGNSYELPSRGISNVFDVSSLSFGTIKGEIVELLPKDGGNDIAVYDISVARPAISENGDNAFYSVSFILGSVSGGANVMARGNSCSTPNTTAASNYNYCTINKFNFAIQVNGG